MPRKLGKAISEIRQEMHALSAKITSLGGMLQKLKSNVVHEDEFLNLTSMTSKQYASLRTCACDVMGKKESVIPQWLGLPVPPADPYQDGKIHFGSLDAKLDSKLFLWIIPPMKCCK